MPRRKRRNARCDDVERPPRPALPGVIQGPGRLNDLLDEAIHLAQQLAVHIDVREADYEGPELFDRHLAVVVRVHGPKHLQIGPRLEQRGEDLGGADECPHGRVVT